MNSSGEDALDGRPKSGGGDTCGDGVTNGRTYERIRALGAKRLLAVTGEQRIHRGLVWYSTSSIQERDTFYAKSEEKGTESRAQATPVSSLKGLPLTLPLFSRLPPVLLRC
nr:hypothetical protein CFP56_25969 [Quercus suber]